MLKVTFLDMILLMVQLITVQLAVGGPLHAQSIDLLTDKTSIST